MSREEIGKKIIGDDFDDIKFRDNLGREKRRKADRDDKRIRNAKVSVENTKKSSSEITKEIN